MINQVEEVATCVLLLATCVRLGMRLLVFYFFCGWPGGWVSGRVGVEIEVNANSAPNRVGVGAGAELGKKFVGSFLIREPVL